MNHRFVLHKRWIALAALGLAVAQTAAADDSFSRQFERIRKTATKDQLYRFLFALPKGGDLHNHLSLATMAESWWAAATDRQRNHGNEFLTRLRFHNCPDSSEPMIRFRNIQRSTWLKLSACSQKEYEPLASLSPEMKEQWLSSLKLDKPGEGRNEFFEVIGQRLGEMPRDPYLTTDLMVEDLKSYAAQGLRYLETQQSGGRQLQDRDGNAIDPAVGIGMIRAALNSPEVKATGMTVRFLYSINRFAPDAEQQLEHAYAFVDQNRDLWVGINMVGREDNGKGYPLRLLETFRKMRRTYSGIQLSLHGGEADNPGQNVRQTLLLGATRIGHGLNLISDPDTMLLMQSGRYLVEINLISNQLLEYVPDLSKHPFPEYLRFGVPVCLNTDDPGAWDSDITDEYYTAVTLFNLSWSEIVQLGRDSLRYSFAEPAVKQRLLDDYAREVAAFERRLGGDDWAAKLSEVKLFYTGYANRNFGLSAH